MRAHAQKILFILLALLFILCLLYWALFDFISLFPWAKAFPKSLGIENYFRYNSDAILFTISWSVIIVTVGSILAFLFYRKACRVGPILATLLTCVVHSLAAPIISQRIGHIRSYLDGSPLGWKLLMGLFLLCALVSAVWLIAAMVKYPKAPKKQSAA